MSQNRDAVPGMEIFLFLVGRSLARFASCRPCLGYFVQFGASCILLYKIWKHKSIYGLSIDTQARLALKAFR